MLFAIMQNRGEIGFGDLLLMLFSYAVLILVMLPVHELAHALVAHWLGDDTARWNGRLTLNPFAHLDLWGSLMLVLFGYGYARPVPVNSRNFRNPKSGMALVALAGPVSNLLMAFVSILLYRVIVYFPVSPQVADIAAIVLIWVFASVNVSLAVFNLLPIPPLDGSRILNAVLPYRVAYAMQRYEQYIRIGLMVLLLTGTLSRPLSILADLVLDLLFRLVGLIPLL